MLRARKIFRRLGIHGYLGRRISLGGGRGLDSDCNTGAFAAGLLANSVRVMPPYGSTDKRRYCLHFNTG